MVGWVFQWISSVRARFRHSVDLVLELTVLRHQIAVLRRTGTRRPCFRPGKRLFWVVLSRWWVRRAFFVNYRCDICGREIPRCRAVLSGIHQLAETGWLAFLNTVRTERFKDILSFGPIPSLAASP
jgi:hypothetical protein